MIGHSALYACTAACHTGNDLLIRYVDIDREIDRLSLFRKSLCESLCLRDRTRESIEDVSLFAVRLADPVHNKVNSQFIRNKKSLVHECFRFLSKFCSVLDISPEDISGRNVRDSVLFRDSLCLGSFSGTRRAQHNDLHNCYFLHSS